MGDGPFECKTDFNRELAGAGGMWRSKADATKYSTTLLGSEICMAGLYSQRLFGEIEAKD